MHKSGKTRWGVWSEWLWHDEYQRYYRQRQDTDGKLDYEWHNEGPSSSTEAAARAAETPRETGIDQITHDLQGTHLRSPSSTGYDAQSSNYTIHKSKTSSKSKSKSKSSSSKSKGKSRAHDDDDDDGNDTERETSHGTTSYRAAESPQTYYDEETGQYYTYPNTAGAATSAAYPDATSTQTPRSAADYSRSRQYDDDAPDEEEDPRFAEAIAASKRYNYTAHNVGESSRTSAYGPTTAYEYEDDGPPTPRAGSSNHITGTEGEMEQLDPRYRVEHSNKFQPGEIFKVLWCEPQGSGNDGPRSVSDRFEYQDRYGGKLFVGFRRFIVVANDLGHCTCVPILTYGGKGCNKRGVKPEKHGIVYEQGHKARLLSGEPKLGFAPVRVEITMDGEKLSKESRVNYSKLVTVEHNVKVLFIGRVMPHDWDLVFEAVNKCWEEKTHYKKKHTGR